MLNQYRAVFGWAFLFFLSVFIFVSDGRFGGDGLENYLTAESIVLDGDFSIHDRQFGVKEMRYEDRGNRDAQGKFYSSYGLAAAFVLVPFYFTGHVISKVIHQVPHDYITQFAVSLVNPIILALLAVFLIQFLIKLRFTFKTSFIASAIYSFCSMSLICARSGFSEL
jgi:hypothetical protein